MNAEIRRWENSSLIARSIYNEDEQELYIEFNNGGKYTFSEVSPTEYADFCSAESQGSFFGKNIRGKKPFTKETLVEDDNTQSI